MATTKATFTLDPQTVARLSETAERLQRSKSEIVREAIHDYSDRAGRLSERERQRMLATIDELLPRIPARPAAEVDAELDEIHAARRGGGRGAGSRRRT